MAKAITSLSTINKFNLLFESVRGLPIVGIQLLVNIRIDESDDDRPRVNVLGRTGRVEFSYARG